MIFRFPAVLAAALCTALPLASQTEIHRNDRLTNWSLFDDDGYCWIATNARFPGRDRLLLTVDLEGSVALFIDTQSGAVFDDTANHLMALGLREVPFLSRGVWAWTRHESPERLLDTILTSDTIGYEVVIVEAGQHRTLRGQWDTEEAQQAYDTLREDCGR
ncbi:MAG: hypothetical protein CMF72_22290 [Mameliella sp.]|nr:hypothetical protein [Mameliella sp.]|tara:strand:+ start:17644 stop:18126 length:483 start_codon:yes stop_codon:yes gene_type:complete